MTDPRHIPLEGGLNLRDVGGVRTASGRTVARGRLFRSGALSRLTDDDVKLVDRLGVRTVIDFRVVQEVTADGPDRLPDGVAATRLPVGGGAFQQLQEAAADKGVQGVGESLAGGGAIETMVEMTRSFVSDEVQREQFAIALRAIADTARLPLLYHCTAGKDRTGWMTAIVLRLLDVPMDEITADYVLSNRYFRDAMDGIVAAAEVAGIDGRLIRPLLEQRPEYLRAAFDEADALFGSFAAFVGDGLGVDDDTVDHIRRSLLD